jgi:prophage regulatory protein
MSRRRLLETVHIPSAGPPGLPSPSEQWKAWSPVAGIGEGTRIQRLPVVQRRTGLSRSAIYQGVKEGRFPAPIALGDRAVGWLEAEVDAWIAERISASRSAP